MRAGEWNLVLPHFLIGGGKNHVERGTWGQGKLPSLIISPNLFVFSYLDAYIWRKWFIFHRSVGPIFIILRSSYEFEELRGYEIIQAGFIVSLTIPFDNFLQISYNLFFIFVYLFGGSLSKDLTEHKKHGCLHLLSFSQHTLWFQSHMKTKNMFCIILFFDVEYDH